MQANNATTLHEVLVAAADEVASRKLDQLRRALERAVGRPLSLQAVEDPIIIRQALAETLTGEGASIGVVHSFEQFYMGVIRRAAVKGLILAPPEGPWTRLWQSVLDASAKTRGAKAPLRSLAAWATARHVQPTDISVADLASWRENLRIDDAAFMVVQDVLNRWSSAPRSPKLSSDSLLLDRLKKKASYGSVRIGVDPEAAWPDSGGRHGSAMWATCDLIRLEDCR